MSIPVYYLLCLGWGYLAARHGSEELKRELLPRIAAGKLFLGIATTESSGRSDLARIRTTATKQDGKYIINGEKIYIGVYIRLVQSPLTSERKWRVWREAQFGNRLVAVHAISV
jgi:hypothetical protein